MMTANFADWVAISETKARYCRCLDTKDWAGYADCFTEDVVLETPPAGDVTSGRDEVGQSKTVTPGASSGGRRTGMLPTPAVAVIASAT